MTTIDELHTQEVLAPISVSGFVGLTEKPAPRPTGRKILGFVLLSVVLAGLGAQFGYFGFNRFDQEWKARAEVQYRGSAWTETQNVAVQSRSITEPVAVVFGIPISEFEENLDAGLIAGTQIVRIDYVSTDSIQARAVVAAIAQAYIDEASEIAPQELRAALSDRLLEAQANLDEAEIRLLEPASDLRLGAEVQQRANQALVSSLRARVGDLELRILDGDLQDLDDLENGVPVLVTDPFVFEDPVFPKPRLMGAIGGVAGLTIGFLALMTYWNIVAWRQGPVLRT
jgi:hypothetical protein